jgi:hypothetical protein
MRWKNISIPTGFKDLCFVSYTNLTVVSYDIHVVDSIAALFALVL